jgi:hypothetical protein
LLLLFIDIRPRLSFIRNLRPKLILVKIVFQDVVIKNLPTLQILKPRHKTPSLDDSDSNELGITSLFGQNGTAAATTAAAAATIASAITTTTAATSAPAVPFTL